MDDLINGGKLTPAGILDEMVKIGGIARPILDRAKATLAKVAGEGRRTPMPRSSLSQRRDAFIASGR
jgi:hypothetical protein